jgi:arylsulfatase A-like enzyme
MPQRPNILWLLTDEQRADSLSYEGTPWARTPNLDRLAREGTYFRAAYTPSPVCIPARACQLTGRPGSSIGVLNNHHWLSLDDPKFLTWEFAKSGYQVASFGKQHYACPRRAFDVEKRTVLSGRVGYTAYNVPVDADEAAVVRYDGGDTPWILAGRFPGGHEDTAEMQNVRDALEWMRSRDPSRPYFLRVSFNAPHTPVVAPAPFDTAIEADAIHLPLDIPGEMELCSRTQGEYLVNYAGNQRLTEQQIRRARQCYYGRTAFLDDAFGVLVDELDRSRELDNTIVVFCSDHGAHLGDHGFFQKQSFFDAAARVPFLFRWAGQVPAGRIVDEPVSTGSLLPTLLECAGLDASEWPDYPSLAQVLAGGDRAQRPVFSEVDYGLRFYREGERRVMVRDRRWKLAIYRDPGDPGRLAGNEDTVLFDMGGDAGERRNLAGDPCHADTVAELVASIDAWDASRRIMPPSPSAAHLEKARARQGTV